MDALARELPVEVGLRLEDLGPEIWTKTALFPMSDWDRQVDHIHIVRVRHFVPQRRLSAGRLLAEHVHEIRWKLQELATSRATFALPALPALLENFVSGPTPGASPITGF